MKNNIEKIDNEIYRTLELKNKELLLLLKWVKKFKNWPEEFKKFKSSKELEDFYERQRKTFWSKEKSPAASLYFYNFILAFLKFYPNYSNRQIEIIWILFRNLKKIDNWLYLELLEHLPINFKKKIEKEKSRWNDWKLFFENVQSLDELLNIYEKHRLAFHHKWRDISLIDNYYLPFIKRFIKFYSIDLDEKYKKRIYNAFLLLELNARKIDGKFKLETYFINLKNNIKSDAYNEFYKEFVIYSVKSKNVLKRWEQYFSYLDLKQLDEYYKKTLATFGQKAKSNYVWFFRWFIKAYLIYREENLAINQKLLTLINYLKKIDEDYEKFLDLLNISYEDIKLNAKKFSYIMSKKGGLKWKKHLEWIKERKKLSSTKEKKIDKKKEKKKFPSTKEKKKSLKQTNNNTNNNIDKKKILKQSDNFEKEKKIDIEKTKKNIFYLLELKWLSKDGKTWYEKWVEKLKAYLKNKKLSEKEQIKLIKILNINDIFYFYKNNILFKTKNLEKEIILKFSDLKTIFTLSEKYHTLFDKIYKKVFKTVNDIEKEILINIYENIKKYKK